MNSFKGQAHNHPTPAMPCISDPFPVQLHGPSGSVIGFTLSLCEPHLLMQALEGSLASGQECEVVVDLPGAEVRAIGRITAADESGEQLEVEMTRITQNGPALMVLILGKGLLPEPMNRSTLVEGTQVHRK